MSAGPAVALRMRRETDERARLTEPGWPRPQAPGPADKMLPVPWIVPPPEWATMNPDRGVESLTQKLCQVCGEGHEEPSGGQPPRCVIFQSGRLIQPETGAELGDLAHAPRGAVRNPRVLLTALDGGMLHERCAKLAVAKCPHLARSLANDRLFAFTVPVADCEVIRKHGKPSLIRVPGDRAEVWDPPTARRA